MPRIPARIVIWQFAVGIAGALVWLVLDNPLSGLAALVGGLISALLSLYFAVKVFGRRLPDNEAGARQMAGLMFGAEARKLVLAVVLFAAAAILLPHGLLPLITTFAAAYAVYFVALLWTDTD